MDSPVCARLRAGAPTGPDDPGSVPRRSSRLVRPGLVGTDVLSIRLGDSGFREGRCNLAGCAFHWVSGTCARQGGPPGHCKLFTERIAVQSRAWICDTQEPDLLVRGPRRTRPDDRMDGKSLPGSRPPSLLSAGVGGSPVRPVWGTDSDLDPGAASASLTRACVGVPNQRSHRKAIWRTRALPTVLEILPKDASVAKLAFGAAKLAVLNTL